MIKTVKTPKFYGDGFCFPSRGFLIFKILLKRGKT